MSDPWQDNTGGTDPGFEQALVNRIAREFLAEQRRARRWNIAFKLFIALVVAIFITIYLVGRMDISPGSLSIGKHTALIDVQGIIAASEQARADYVTASLRAAYEDSNTAGIIIRINSPGGSPVQAGHVNDEITRLKNEYPEIPVYAVLGDLCASGGYYNRRSSRQNLCRQGQPGRFNRCHYVRLRICGCAEQTGNRTARLSRRRTQGLPGPIFTATRPQTWNILTGC